jgi:hypothetical protein
MRTAPDTVRSGFCGAAAPTIEGLLAPENEGAMVAKPNYNFERRERERLKAEKKAKRLADKKRGSEETSSEPSETPPVTDE